ncbi:MAG TPA: hypothetical protein VGI92_04500 [Gemmatimonadales bacterium]
MRRSLIVAGLLMATVVAGARGQEVLLRIGGQQGQSMKYQTVMEMWMSGGAMPPGMTMDTTQPFMRRTAFQTRTVTAVTGDTLTMTEVTDSTHVETPAMPQMAGMMQAMAQMTPTVTTRMNDRGVIYSTSVDMGAAGAGGGGMAGMGGGGAMGGGRGGRGGPGGMAGLGRNQRTFFELPRAAVHVGDSWVDTMNVAGATPEEPTTNMVATYNLKRVDQRGGARIAVVGMTGTLSTSGGTQPPQQMAMNGEFQLDVSGRKLAGMNMAMNGTVQTPRGTTPVKMNMTMTPLP